MKPKLPKETEEKIAQLQLLEQRLQSFLLQKQQFQTQLLELENSLEELKKTKGNTFKITGPIMIETKKETLEKDLKEKKDLTELRIKNLEKQEKEIKDQATPLQEEILKKLEK